MKENTQLRKLTVYTLTQPLADTEWAALSGHKFQSALPFQVEFIDDPATADVIAWNGILTPKSMRILEPMIERLNKGGILLLMGEGRTLLHGHPFVKFVDTSSMRVVVLSGWSVLPEEMLAALQSCWEKITHV